VHRRRSVQRTFVVFDVGGVLVDGSYERLALEILGDVDEASYFVQEVLGAEFHLERDLGTPMAVTAAKFSQRHPEYAAAIERFTDEFPKTWIGPIRGTVAVLEELSASRVPVYGLTNWGNETWPIVCDRFPFLRTFDGVLVSADVGLVKPDPQIFELFCARFDVDPHHGLFVDDVVANVDAARALGFAGVQYTTPDDLRIVLAEHALL
jgi:2-haloacid dehalogenase